MGVDYYVCDYCGETFADCGHYVSCECGKDWCSDECAEEDGFRKEEYGFTPNGSKWEQETSCKYCRQDDFEDGTLLGFALTLLGKTREELIQEYKSNLDSE